jgi:hypothetical protein
VKKTLELFLTLHVLRRLLEKVDKEFESKVILRQKYATLLKLTVRYCSIKVQHQQHSKIIMKLQLLLHGLLCGTE